MKKVQEKLDGIDNVEAELERTMRRREDGKACRANSKSTVLEWLL